MKTTLIAAALSIAVSPMAVAHAAGNASYTITFNGQQVAQGNDGECGTSNPNVAVGEWNIYLPKPPPSFNGPTPAPSAQNTPPWSALVVLDPGPKLHNLTITQHGPEGGAYQASAGENSVNQSGNRYTITGTAFDYHLGANGNVPYQIDVTCPDGQATTPRP